MLHKKVFNKHHRMPNIRAQHHKSQMGNEKYIEIVAIVSALSIGIFLLRVLK